MAERQHTEHAPKRRSKGGKAHGAGELELMRQHLERQAAEFSATVSGAGDDKENAAPGSNLATPIAVAVGALVLGRMGSILGGLTDLIGKLTAGSAAPQVNSWIGPGANQPIQPGQLGSALGQNTLNELAQRTGMSQEELLNQLATVLPQLINHLTPNDRMPMADLEKDDSADPLRWKPDRIGLALGAGYLVDVSTLLGGRTVLGSMIESDLEAHELLHRGLPRGALTSLIDKLHDIPVTEVSEALGMSLRTLQRHKSTPVELLDVQQSGRTWKFAEILAKATRMLGSQDEAEQWLKRPAIGLDQERPIDLLTTPAGVKLVEDYLGRLEYDVYT
jgi:putative toxin-antitoxin system antitoxin component (TIGR02293 family)